MRSNRRIVLLYGNIAGKAPVSEVKKVLVLFSVTDFYVDSILMAITIGTQAPAFTASADGNATIALRDLQGKKVVLYFYPKDNTSGCTKEACNFRDSMEQITQAGAVVLGVSPDSVALHDKFKAAHNLNFHLLSDTEKTLCEAYGVWVEKSMYGRKYMGVERSTFIIDESGAITHIFRKVKVPGHVEAVLQALNESA